MLAISFAKRYDDPMRRLHDPLALSAMTSLEELAHLIARHATGQRTTTPIKGLSLLRSDTVRSVPVQVVYTPMVCVIAQGRKEVCLADETYAYDAARYLVSSVDLPVTGRVVGASARHPYLSLSFALDVDELSAILLAMHTHRVDADVPRGLAVSALDAPLLDAFVRLLRLLERPADIPVLAPLVTREILYRLLAGEQGAMLRQVALRDSRTRRVTRVIGWLRAHYAEPFRMSDLMAIANMSAPSLHRHFKALTAMSPLQYQKQIRLQEARRILVSEGHDAATVGFAVGYESPSQFSREYARLFGSPPRKHLERLLADDGALVE